MNTNFLNIDWRQLWFQPYSKDSPFPVLVKNTLIAFGIFVLAVVPLHIYIFFFWEDYFELANPLFFMMYGVWTAGIITYSLQYPKISFLIIFLGGQLYLYYICSFFGKDSLLYLMMLFNTGTIVVVLGHERVIALSCFLVLSVMVLFGYFTDFNQFYNPQTLPYQSMIADYTIVSLLGINFLILWTSIQNIHKSGEEYKIAKEHAENLVEKGKEMEEMLQEKNRELQKYIDSNLQLENFAYAASHDLREPIRTITSFSQLLEKRQGEQLDEAGKEYLSFIIKAGKNMNELIQDMLAYAKIDTSGSTHEPIQTKMLIQEVLQNLHVEILEKEANIELGELPEEIVGDVTKLRQLFQNLLSNGIKFHKAEILPVIRISGKTTDLGWEFRVEDNGVGIREDFYEKVFLIFRRLHDKAKYGGSGIGLAICKKVVELHGGKIWIESQEGKGSTFFFTLSSSPESVLV